jgi:hypothetical protein
MSKAAKAPAGGKADKGKKDKGPKPRSAEKDFWTFTIGVGSLIYVLVTTVPN